MSDVGKAPRPSGAEPGPSTIAAADDAPACACGAMPHPSTVGMCSSGHFIKGNQARRTHGAYSFRDRGPTALPDVLRQTVEEFREAVVAEKGGLPELSTIEAAYIRRLAEVETVARLLAADLASRGLMTAKGRVRGTVGKWFECIDRWDRLAQRVGAGARKPVLTLSQRLAAMPPTEPATTTDAVRAQQQHPRIANDEAVRE